MLSDTGVQTTPPNGVFSGEPDEVVQRPEFMDLCAQTKPISKCHITGEQMKFGSN